MTYAQAAEMLVNEIPVIDMEPLRNGQNPKQVANAMHTASHGLGFIYVKGHGISDKTIAAARSSAYEFFRADPKFKAGVKISPQHRGWLGQGEARMNDGVRPDLKESFVWGYQDAKKPVPKDHPLRGDNQWPEFLPKMEHHAMAYFNQVHEVAVHLMRGFAIGLDLPEDFFLANCSQPLSRASYVYYPPQAEKLGDKQFGVGAHTDFGVLTVLCQDDVGGLEVCNIEGDWIKAPPIEGSLIVNVGDLLSRWTDGAYNSTLHRVVNRSGRERLSLVLAFDPDPQTLIDPQQIFGTEYSGAHEPITCGDYLNWRFEKAFSYRKKRVGQ